MKTFHVQTLGCKVNQYESEQIAALLTARGLEAADAGRADLRVINTCSVTMQAASQSRQSVRRMVRLPVLSAAASPSACASKSPQVLVAQDPAEGTHRPRVIVTGCWATSNAADAAALPGVDAVLGHHHDVARELDRLLTLWQTEPTRTRPPSVADSADCSNVPPKSLGMDSGRQVETGTPTGRFTPSIQPKSDGAVNHEVKSGEEVKSEECRVKNEGCDAGPSHSSLFTLHSSLPPSSLPSPGTTSLPLLGARQAGRQRAFVKIQDGCDAHCTYCIIPSLRPSLWSKPVEQVVGETQALVQAGHVEIVLTGIFMGAYGQPTALRRRQPRPTAEPLGELIEAICTNVPGLRRLRLSSLEPGDFSDDLVAILRAHRQVVPHFHLPLQSGSDPLLRRMNRQYTRDEFLKMVDRLNEAFDRPALTTDVVVGFPGENDEEFERTAEVVRASGFIHVHAFPYSPRPGTAAARWTKQFIRGPVVNQRIERLQEMAAAQSFAFRQSFLGQSVEVIIERDSQAAQANGAPRHGRCERYFAVEVDGAGLEPGDSVRVVVSAVSQDRTVGKCQVVEKRTKYN